MAPLRTVLLAGTLAVTGCPNTLTEVCGLSTELPDVDKGSGTAALDGAPFDGAASWAPGSNASVTVGALDMTIARDETGSQLDDLLGDNALPICVRLAEATETSGNALFNEDNGYRTDNAHTGGVAILALDGDVLVGRFRADVVDASNTSERAFTDGEFRALRRE